MNSSHILVGVSLEVVQMQIPKAYPYVSDSTGSVGLRI